MTDYLDHTYPQVYFDSTAEHWVAWIPPRGTPDDDPDTTPPFGETYWSTEHDAQMFVDDAVRILKLSFPVDEEHDRGPATLTDQALTDNLIALKRRLTE